ncbi:MAG TPA: sigma-70 family RNA polymerase sigma factor [Spirochaetales bacterium]|nr:sigma-70 family RNA polymerase sigma factor [Spirochaetales bacterium]
MSGHDPEPSDDELVSRVLDGDRNAFGDLVQRYQGRILRLGWGFFHNQDAAQDFAQDVFLKAYAGLASFRKASSFSTWLTRIAYNDGINAQRKFGRYQSMDSEPEENRLLSPEDAFLVSESVAELRSAMTRLPEHYAVCLDLYFREGMKYEDIGKVTGFPVNTIKSHVFRAKRDLRVALTNGGKEGL